MLSPLIEAAPRTLMVISLPGAPEVLLTETPAICPCRACSTRLTGLSSITSAPTFAIEPTTFDFLIVPYPTTTTSSKVSVSSNNVILNTDCPATEIS